MVYYTIVALCWCMTLGCESWMQLTYRRDAIPDRNLVRDFLVSAEPVAAADAA
jgi:hypothetical protein